MKIRIGVITQNREDALKIREGFQDVLAIPAKNVIDLYQVNGTQPLQAIVFIDSGDLAKEFKSYHSFIRSKHGYQQIPLLILTANENFKLQGIVLDSLVRIHSAREGLFLGLLNFMSVINKTETLGKVLEQNIIEGEFVRALNEKLGQSSNFKARSATDDESHAGFFAGMNGEIASNLIWIKFSARILDQGSQGLKETFKTFTESEIEETTTKILQLVLEQFQSRLQTILKEKGAVFLQSVESASPQDRNALVKMGKSNFILFESSACSVLLEQIRYI